MKKNQDEDPLEKLVKLTKLMKAENVKVAPKGPAKATNKWRSAEPKFTEKAPKAVDVVNAGGMDVDPARREEYENWRKDKEEEERYRREQSAKKAAADEKARVARRAAEKLEP